MQIVFILFIVKYKYFLMRTLEMTRLSNNMVHVTIWAIIGDTRPTRVM